MVGALECVITSGSGIQVQCGRNRDGSISILLRPFPGTDEPLQLLTQDSDTSAASKTIRIVPGERTANEEGVIEGGNKIYREVDPFNEQIQKLREKIEKRWRSWKAKLEEDFDRWSADPSTFFEGSGITSTERWSFESLNDLRDGAQQTRAPFHRANLSHHLWRRMEQCRSNNYKPLDIQSVESRCRKSMMAAIYPGYQNLLQKQQWRLYKRFERYLEQGRVLRMMESFNAGLLLTVARFLTTKEYVRPGESRSEAYLHSCKFLSDCLRIPCAFAFPWLTPAILDASPKYEALSRQILALMQENPGHWTSTSNHRRFYVGSAANSKRPTYNFANSSSKRQRPSPRSSCALMGSMETEDQHLFQEQPGVCRICDTFHIMTAHPPPALSHLQSQAITVYHTSVQLRCSGRVSDSENLITSFLGTQALNSNHPSDFCLGLLHLSQANNRIYWFDFRRAREESGKWQPPSDTLSDCELGLLCDKLWCSARILRGEGRFDEASHCLERWLATAQLPARKRPLAISLLSDVYCELDFLQQEDSCQSVPQSINYLEKGREIVEQELDRGREQGQPPQSLRRLLLALLEINIRQECHDEAKSIIKQLLGVYSKIPDPDINDKLGHVRTLIARARTTEVHEMEPQWNVALLQNRAYNPLEEDVFTCGVIYLFITLARLCQEDCDGARRIFETAKEVIRRKAPHFLMPGMGTYLLDSVRSNILSMTGWTLPETGE